MLTTGHSHLRADYVPAVDAETVRRLKAGGAVILGKLATHEFANGAMTPDQPFPAARNPWNTDYQPGGSSSGSGAAVAAAAVHGRHGLRHRRLDPQPGGLLRHRRHQADLRAGQPLRHLPACRFSFDTAGPLAWTVEDNALMLDVLAGYDPNDQALGQGAQGRLRRVDPSLDQGHAHRAGAQLVRGRTLTADMAKGMDEAVRVLRDLGADRRGRRLPRHLGLSHLRPRRDHGRGARHPSAGGDRDAGEVRLHDAPALPARRLHHRRAVPLGAALPAQAAASTRARPCAATTW